MLGLDLLDFNMERFLIGFVTGVGCSYLITTYVINRLSDSVNRALMVILASSRAVGIITKDEQE